MKSSGFVESDTRLNQTVVEVRWLCGVSKGAGVVMVVFCCGLYGFLCVVSATIHVFLQLLSWAAVNTEGKKDSTTMLG